MDDVARWLLGPARLIRSPADLLDQLSWRMLAAGLPIARTTFHIGTLHPQFLGVFCRWRRATGRTDEAAIAHGVRETDAYRRSPLRDVLERAEIFRQRLDIDETGFAFPILAELRAEGLSDYVAMPLRFSDGQVAAVTWSTDRPGGFSDTETEQIRSLLPVLELLIEIQAVRRIAANLLDVYLGHQTGQRVLSGAVTRGTGETIRAVLLYTDLRGFTNLSDRLPAEEVIVILNAYFERVVGAIHAQNGEVLKFIGDGLLAIFPIEDAAFAFNAARRGLDAAVTAFASLCDFNETRQPREILRMAAALHVGDIVYGNIGGEDRLDFTAIGPAVNLVSRLHQQSKRLDRSLLMTREFADVCERPLVSLGWHPLRGLSEPREVLTLADWDDPLR